MSLRIQSKSKMIASVFLSLLVLILRLVTAPVAQAHCPLCVAGAAVGVTLTHWVGVDDSITGVWVAALLGAMSFWFYSWLLSKKIEFVEKNRALLKPAIYIAVFISTLWSFYKFQLVIRMSQLFGFDKLTFGMLTGGVLFYLVDILDDFVIKKEGKVLFPYQRIIVSLGSMAALSLLIYILINYFI